MNVLCVNGYYRIVEGSESFGISEPLGLGLRSRADKSETFKTYE